MGKTGKVILVTAAATVVVIGGVIVAKLNNWLGDKPDGPGSGDELPADWRDGPGSGDELPPGEPTPNWPDGPGSGDELPPGEPTPNWPDGPGSGDELPPGEPTPNWPDGPGSGDELPPGEPTPNWPDGPGSGDELEWEGPGSGDELIVMSSCNVIAEKSTCVDYVGTYWKNDNYAKSNCSDTNAWSKNHCPKDYIGGCAVNSETDNEMIIWHYEYGGAAYDSESAKYAAMACNANPAGTWWQMK